jgi:hypothetical protein
LNAGKYNISVVDYVGGVTKLHPVEVIAEAGSGGRLRKIKRHPQRD